jgi:protein phosphatase
MKIASKTDTGRVRTNNEDSILVDQERGIFLLADGMGGHNAGEVASKLAVDSAYDFLKDRISTIESDEELLRALDAAIMRAHEAIKEKAASDIKLRGMGTTLVALVTKNEKAYICHVGDSRAYLLRESLKQMTKDHTMGEYLVEQKIMSRKKVPAQQWYTLTQAAGTGEKLIPDKNKIGLKSGDILLLCSDGLTDMLNDIEIESLLKQQGAGLKNVADSLIEVSNNKGGRDNISVVIVQYD